MVAARPLSFMKVNLILNEDWDLVNLIVKAFEGAVA
jgi:hypothetical protein